MRPTPLVRLALAALVWFGTGCEDAGHIADLDTWIVSGESGTASRAARLPTHVSRTDDEWTATSYAMSTRVRLPTRARGRRVWFVVAQLPARTELTVDGADAPSIVFEPWESAWSSGPQIFEIPAGATRDGSLELEWRIVDTWPLGEWHDRVPELREVGSIGREARVTLATSFFVATILIGGLLAIAFSSIAATLVDRREKAHRWVVATISPILPFGLFQAGILQAFVPHRFEFATMCLSLALGLSFFGRLLVERFELGIPWWTTLPTTLLIVVAAIVLRNHPHLAFYVVGTLTSITATVAILPPVAAMVRGVGRGDVPGRSSFAITVGLGFLASSPDMLYFGGLGDYYGGGHAAVVAIVGIAVVVVLLLARDRALQLRTANEGLELRAIELRDERARLGLLRTELETHLSHGKERVLEAVVAISRRHAPRTRLERGDVVDDRYRVIRTLGVGGMGSVYEVERVSDRRRFALKVSHELDGSSLARLAREALIGANVRSESIVKSVDVGIAHEGYLFVVMELFESRPLSESRSRYGDVAWALPILATVARALAAVHRAGVVHRDLKPSNILLGAGDDARVKLADFGISRFVAGSDDESATSPRRPLSDPPAARLDGADSASTDAPTSRVGRAASPSSTPVSLADLTGAGLVAGTAAYMAPEAIASLAPTTAADVFGFGVIAYQVLTGERPFATAADLVSESEEASVVPALADRDLPLAPGLVRVLDACREVSPSLRPTMDEVVRAFERGGVAAPRRRDQALAGAELGAAPSS